MGTGMLRSSPQNTGMEPELALFQSPKDSSFLFPSSSWVRPTKRDMTRRLIRN